MRYVATGMLSTCNWHALAVAVFQTFPMLALAVALVAAVFQAFPSKAWGLYAARDTAFMPGSLQKLAGHMWSASRDNSIEVALMNW
jgi:hypothetical protein